MAAYFLYTNVIAGPGSGPAPAPRAARETAEEPLIPPAAGAPAGAPVNYGAPARAGAPVSSRARGDEFHPVLHSKRAEDRVDPMTIDPTLRLDLLAKLQNEEPAGGSRNLFQFGAPPPKVELPKGPEPKIVPSTFCRTAALPGAERIRPEAPAPPPPRSRSNTTAIALRAPMARRPRSSWMATRSWWPARAIRSSGATGWCASG